MSGRARGAAITASAALLCALAAQAAQAQDVRKLSTFSTTGKIVVVSVCREERVCGGAYPRRVDCSVATAIREGGVELAIGGGRKVAGVLAGREVDRIGQERRHRGDRGH